MVSPSGVNPKGSGPAPKHHRVAGPVRPAWGEGGRPAQRLLTYTKNPFRVIGWQGPSQTFFFSLGLVH